MLNLLLLLLILYAALLAGMYVFQRSLMYHPASAMGTPAQHGLTEFSEHFITTPDGETLQLWYRAAGGALPTVLYFHGNAGNIAGRAGIFAALAARGFGVAALSYRGYGQSSGQPSEQGLYRDAAAAIGWLANDKNTPENKLIVYGESLGTGVASWVATQHNIGLLVLQAPYLSVAKRAQEIYPFIPVSMLLKDHFNSASRIASIHAPLLLFHGEEDTVIPIHHGRALLAMAPEPKRSFFLPGVGHNDFDSRAISSHVEDYARELGLIPQ
ncbi:MAG: alpha/beta hydrolase [Alphaproteobacteria bacterium]|nr:alpha/beta hydrolase [Alphaproteobacteria bacterium]